LFVSEVKHHAPIVIERHIIGRVVHLDRLLKVRLLRGDQPR